MGRADGRYKLNEVFYSVQGEGLRAGTANVFVRFSHCNLRCAVEPGPRSPGGFDCDTEFESGRWLDLEGVRQWIEETLAAQGVSPPMGEGPVCDWMILTGGEPGLQVDKAFCSYFHQRGWKIAVETNGSVLLPHRLDVNPHPKVADHKGWPTAGVLSYFHLDWITVSPKVAEHAIRQHYAHEVKYVRGYGQAVPETRVRALHRLISPAFDGNTADHSAIQWCVELVKQNPDWQLSVQAHKLWLPDDQAVR